MKNGDLWIAVLLSGVMNNASLVSSPYRLSFLCEKRHRLLAGPLHQSHAAKQPNVVL
ncbi:MULTISPECIES: hypothetical protein [Pseudomonas]|uniref:hypothetical protein n=1 Tax=Pseudomonas TaxID=286 RepID=UPI00148344D7|nr:MULTISPECIES: hypothetical protein [Pseudomonas]MCX4216963.1 hypothetical protein [Pseudomonas sp. MCal1]UDI94472.1 hypothetical protein I5961_08030 [Pseudomonas sp. IAC-BECa141]UIN52785.1 hypothetical protein LXN51_17445 [Pseudomonas kribbensis]